MGGADDSLVTPEEQRAEAKTAMLRLFRFRARRGVGVLYSLDSLLFWAAAVLFSLPLSPYVVIAVLVVCWLPARYVASMAGFRGFDSMEYSLDFLEGGEELARDRRKWYRSPRFQLVVSAFWVLAVVAASMLELSWLVLVLLLTLVGAVVLLRTITLSRKEEGIFERRPEDWVVVGALAPLAALALFAGSPSWCFLFAVPIFLISGLKSLCDAPKELTHVA
jgi:hypothetical protein